MAGSIGHEVAIRLQGEWRAERATFHRWVAWKLAQRYFPSEWVRWELQARKLCLEGDGQDIGWSSLMAVLLAMLDPDEHDSIRWWLPGSHVEGEPVAVLLACGLGLNCTITHCITSEWHDKEKATGRALLSTHVGFRWEEWHAWCEEEEAAELRKAGCQLTLLNGQESPDLAIQALHEKQMDQLLRLRSDGVDLSAHDGLSAEDLAIMHLRETGMRDTEIWIGRPTQWLRRVLYVRKHALDLPTAHGGLRFFLGRGSSASNVGDKRRVAIVPGDCSG